MEIFFLIQAYTSTLRMNFSLLPNFVARRSVYLHKIDVHIQFLFLTIQKRRGHQRKIFFGGVRGTNRKRESAKSLLFLPQVQNNDEAMEARMHWLLDTYGSAMDIHSWISSLDGDGLGPAPDWMKDRAAKKIQSKLWFLQYLSMKRRKRTITLRWSIQPL